MKIYLKTFVILFNTIASQCPCFVYFEGENFVKDVRKSDKNQIFENYVNTDKNSNFRDLRYVELSGEYYWRIFTVDGKLIHTR